MLKESIIACLLSIHIHIQILILLLTLLFIRQNDIALNILFISNTFLKRNKNRQTSIIGGKTFLWTERKQTEGKVEAETAKEETKSDKSETERVMWPPKIETKSDQTKQLKEEIKKTEEDVKSLLERYYTHIFF